jgi:DNA-binding MarR family transcriptional regulator
LYIITLVTASAQTFGTLVRHLADLVDLGTEQAYGEVGLKYRPRYTPVVRAILALGPSSIRAIAIHGGITHSAAGQTVAHMQRQGLLELASGADARERIASLSPKLRTMLPTIQAQWRANNAVAAALDEELSAPLSPLLREAIRALEIEPLNIRIARIKGSIEADV